MVSLSLNGFEGKSRFFECERKTVTTRNIFAIIAIMKKNNDSAPAKKKKNKIAYNPTFTRLVCGLTIFLAKILYGAKLSKSARKNMKKGGNKGPMLVLCNHACAIDFAFLSMGIWPRKLSYVVAENMLYWPGFNFFVRHSGSITKKQYVSDFFCIKSIKRYLDGGVSVMMFPEGKVTNDGRTGYIAPSVAKLVKWLGYPVAIGITNGAAVSSPKWAYNKTRRGKLLVDMEIALTSEQLKEMSQDEIYAVIKEKLQHNDNEFQIQNRIKMSGKRFAEGLERIFYKCPKCGAECTYTSKDDVATCSACGNSVRYLRTGELVPASEDAVVFDRIDQWTAWEREELRKETAAEDFSVSDKVELFLENDEIRKIVKVGEGKLTLNREKLCFEGTKSDEPFQIEFPLEFVPTTVVLPGFSIDMYDEEHTYRFVFTDRLISTKYSMAVEVMYEARHVPNGGSDNA